jgi:ferritin-like metal-binding protein YciE
MPSQNAVGALFIDTLKDIYSAEKQILRSLPRMARAAQMDELREAFETHRDQTEDQIGRLDQIFSMIGARSSGPNSEAMESILSEGTELMEAYKGSEAIDAGLIASGQSVEHYEIARYRVLRDLARQLGLDDAVTLLDESLREEKETDRTLTEIAESGANAAAQTASATQATGKAAGQKPGGAARSASTKSASSSAASGTAAQTGSAKTAQRTGGSRRGKKAA